MRLIKLPFTEAPLLSPAGARAVTTTPPTRPRSMTDGCCPPQGRELLRCEIDENSCLAALLSPAGARVVTKGLSCGRAITWLLSPAGARAVTRRNSAHVRKIRVAVPRRGASCYGKNAKNTMQIFGILTIFLYYLLYFCVSIRDIVGFPRCEPACNNLIYCYYNTRFAPNQPVPKPSSIATGCKTRWHKL